MPGGPDILHDMSELDSSSDRRARVCRPGVGARLLALLGIALGAATATGAQDLFNAERVAPGTAIGSETAEQLAASGLANLNEYAESHEFRAFGNRAIDIYAESDLYLYADEAMNGFFSANDTAVFAVRLADGEGILVDLSLIHI